MKTQSSTAITFLVLISLSTIYGCSISNCSTCSANGQGCTQCADGYQLSSDSSSCNSSSNSSSSSTNVGLIVGISVSIAFGVLISYLIYRKCSNSMKKDEEGGTTETQPYTYGGNFGCMGMMDPMHCFTHQYSVTTTNNCYNDKEDYYYNVQIYNKFKNLNEKCLDSRNDCDRCTFKLDRKENLFPNWANQQFEKFVPNTPSKKSEKNTKFASYLTLIPFNILDLSKEDLIQTQTSPIYEAIKKHSIDDKLTVQKQDSNSNSEQYNEKDETISSGCTYKVRSSSVATECPSNTGDQGAADEIFSEENENQQQIQQIDSNTNVLNAESIKDLQLSEKIQSTSEQITKCFSDQVVINFEDQEKGLLKEEVKKPLDEKSYTDVCCDEENQIKIL